MRLTVIIIILILAALAIGGLRIRSADQTSQERDYEDWKDRFSLESVARQAKSEGRQAVTIPAPHFEYSDAIALDEALSSYNLILAEPVEHTTLRHQSDDIRTWYKFKTLELLATGDHSACAKCPSVTPPDTLLPLKPGEFLVATAGGTLSINNVRVTMNDPEYPPFQRSKKYLLFASIRSNGVARIGLGPTGVFNVDETGLIEPINKKPHPIRNEMKERFGSSITTLKELIPK